MQSSSVTKLLLTGGTLVLALVAFIVGGITISSTQAASPKAQSKGASPSKGDQHTNLTKAIFVVNSIDGNTIHANYVLPSDKKGSVTITTTASTIYKPDVRVVSVGKTIFVTGTLNKNGSITAQGIGFYDPTAASFGGIVTKISGSTISLQTKDLTHTIHVTDSTAFLKGQPKTKQTQPASKNDLKQGDTIEAQGKLNNGGSLTADTIIIIPGEALTK